MKAQTREEWREAWPIPLVGMLSNSGATIFIYSSAIFMPALTREFGWSRAGFSLGLTLAICLGMLAGPVVGWIVDRFGSRILVVPGVLIFVVALSAFGAQTGSIVQWWVESAAFALSASLIGPVVWAANVVGRFEASRGMALAVMLSGVGLAASVAPLLSTVYIAHLGWRLAYPALALTWGVLMAPLVILFLLKTGAEPRHAAPRAETDPASPQTVSTCRALLSRPILTLLAAGCPFALVALGLIVHLTPILRAGGMSPSTAAAIAGVAGIGGFAGRLGAGFLLDRYSARVIGAVALTLPVFSCAILLVASGSVPAALGAAILLGLASGAELDVVSYLIARYQGYPEIRHSLRHSPFRDWRIVRDGADAGILDRRSHG